MCNKIFITKKDKHPSDNDNLHPTLYPTNGNTSVPSFSLSCKSSRDKDMNKKIFLTQIIIIGFTAILMTGQNTRGDQDTDGDHNILQNTVRNIAEFEPMESVLIRYPLGISYDIIAEMSQDIHVITIVASSSEQSYVESQYTSHGVEVTNCSFLIAPSDTYWTRDYGPWFIFNNTQGALEVIDFDYNRPRPNDNAIPQAFATNQSLNLAYMDLVHTGGNYMTDGHRISISTNLVYNENPGLSPSQINQTIHETLGIDTYHAYPDPLGEYIEHVDCWAKYLSPDTIMIIEVSPSHSHYTDIETAATYFANQTSCYGTPYTIVRLYTHLSEPYINSLILNHKVLVPITGSQYDAAALTTYQNAMPGYQVLGFTGSWQNTDALHCRTKGIPDRYMLYIEHTPLGDDEPLMEGFPVEATIIPYSGENLTGSPRLYWRTTGEWNTLPLTHTNDSYLAQIPWHPHDTQLYYYLQTMDDSGRNETHPYSGAPGAHSFTVIISPPQVDSIQVTPPSPHQGETVNISAHVTDNKGIESVYLTLTSPTGSTVNFSITQNTTGTIYFCNQTYSQTGQYNFSFYVTDTSNTSIRSPSVNFTLETSETTHHSPLFQGWNLVTVPLGTGYTAETLGKKSSNCTVVVMFDGATQNFTTHVVGTPHDDFPLLDGLAYFVYVTSDSYLNVTGFPIAAVNVSIYRLWTTIGWYHDTATTAESLGQVITNCTVVSMFNATTQTFTTHVVRTPHDNFPIKKGRGVFIYVLTSSWWTGHG